MGTANKNKSHEENCLLLAPENSGELSASLEEAGQSKIYILTATEEEEAEEGSPRRELIDQLIEAGDLEARRIVHLNLSRMNKIEEHVLEDMVISVQTGMSLQELNRHLKEHGQWLPLHGRTKDDSILNLIETGDGGPLESGYGGVRSLVLGLNSTLANGDNLKSGGKIVKNVTGYDLSKLLVGTHSWLAICHSVHLRLFAYPEAATTLVIPFSKLDLLQDLIRRTCLSGLPFSSFEIVSSRLVETSCSGMDKIRASEKDKNKAFAFISFHGYVDEIKKSCQTLKELLSSDQSNMVTMETEDTEILLSNLSRFQSDREAGTEQPVFLPVAPQDFPDVLKRAELAICSSERRWFYRPATGKFCLNVDDKTLNLWHKDGVEFDAFLPGTRQYMAKCIRSKERQNSTRVIEELVSRVKEKFDPSSILNPLVRF